ncbi:glycosyl-4,4'-diaponeurosporenoate acyltransferase CrtO family protein [Imhoffiella purpurea]|uniref:Glycosyl-4,4'-diaponeurosporenoate acyltransferase n=1 Tax=Imhoffiella purpurea TaxID=1249627 RepID=W9VLL2_9GAMM|nr:hypothetical protein [Imhoffiella purpurea]EXJ16992.1 Glycosyl-4,4'-diaponeurosporenoate acyltransferase precursor [Imhoffiella purpurea]
MHYVALYSAIWICFHFGSGYLAYLLPNAAIGRLPLVNASYSWENDGKFYEGLGIRTWKDRLPEAGAFFPGGFSKRRLLRQDASYLGKFVLETSRAECSHWLTWGLSLTFFAWNPWEIGVVMLVYGALSNIPFILVQRYNRARLRRTLRIIERQTRGARPVRRGMDT